MKVSRRMTRDRLKVLFYHPHLNISDEICTSISKDFIINCIFHRPLGLQNCKEIGGKQRLMFLD